MSGPVAAGGQADSVRAGRVPYLLGVSVILTLLLLLAATARRVGGMARGLRYGRSEDGCCYALPAGTCRPGGGMAWHGLSVQYHECSSDAIRHPPRMRHRHAALPV